MRPSLCVLSTVSTKVVVVDAEPAAFWFGAWQNFNVVVWLRPATLDVVKRVERAIMVRYDKHKQRMSTVHIIAPDLAPPEPDVRTALIELNERLGHTVACGAVVIERGGLMGIAVRSAITGMIILAPKHYRVKVFDAYEPCAPWVAEQNNRVATVQLQAAEVLEVLRFGRKSAK